MIDRSQTKLSLFEIRENRYTVFFDKIVDDLKNSTTLNIDIKFMHYAHMNIWHMKIFERRRCSYHMFAHDKYDMKWKILLSKSEK